MENVTLNASVSGRNSETGRRVVRAAVAVVTSGEVYSFDAYPRNGVWAALRSVAVDRLGPGARGRWMQDSKGRVYGASFVAGQS